MFRFMIPCLVTCLILTIFSLENTSYIFSTESENYKLEARVAVTRNDNKFVKTRSRDLAVNTTYHRTSMMHISSICMARRIPRSRAYKIFHNNFSYRIWQLSYFYQIKYTPDIKTCLTNANQLPCLSLFTTKYFPVSLYSSVVSIYNVQNIYCPKLYN